MGELIGMLNLSGKASFFGAPWEAPRLLTVTLDQGHPIAARASMAVLTRTMNEAIAGFGAVLVAGKESEPMAKALGRKVPAFAIGDGFDYLNEGDIVRLDSLEGRLNCLYRMKSSHNTILLTERCNHYCLMCSQPPKEIDDSWLLGEAEALVRMIPPETSSLGFSGGEPTLYGDALLKLIELTRDCLPNTAIDILTNGRRFSDLQFTKDFARINHPDCLLGIPLYSDDPSTHEYVVQSKGAYDETIRGVLNLKRMKQKVEIRVVIHKQTLPRLVSTCEFIARNLVFVDQVALMGLEITGFTRANLPKLWVDPFDYKDVLSDAVGVLASYGMNVVVFNHQLCVVNPDIEPYYVKSISDWKNEFLGECNKCARRSECGGLFSSSKKFRHSDHIRAFP